jgi:hypothetical protein
MRLKIIRIVFLILLTSFFYSEILAQTDTVLYQRDSVIEQETDPTTKFF